MLDKKRFRLEGMYFGVCVSGTVYYLVVIRVRVVSAGVLRLNRRQ